MLPNFDLGDFAFNDREVLDVRKTTAHLCAVGIAIGLSSRGLNRGPSAAIEQAELNSGCVDDLAHYAAEGVDFADEMSLSDSADGRLAAHLPDRIRVKSDQRCARADAHRDVSRFAACVACADYDYFEFVTLQCVVFLRAVGAELYQTLRRGVDFDSRRLDVCL